MKSPWRLLICLSVSVVLVDVVLASLYNTILTGLSEHLILGVYMMASLAFVIVFWNILFLARITPLDIKGIFIRISQISTWLLQLLISAFVISLLLEVITNAKYTQAISSYCVIIGFSGGIFMLTMLLRQLVNSLRIYKSTLLFLYSLAIVFTLTYFTIVTALTYSVIENKPIIVAQSWIMTHIYLPSNSLEWQLAQAVPYFQIVSFLLLWIASGYLIRYHFKKQTSPVFVILLSTPALYFLGRLVDVSYIVSILGGNNVIESIVNIVIRTISPIVGGLIFGLSFYFTSRSLPAHSKLKTYLNITGHGFIVLLISSQYNTILQYPYPPFGTIALSSTYLGAYLLLLGIYSTALSSAQNIKIHNEISRIVQERSKISYEMGKSIFIESIEKQINQIEKGLEQESGIESVPDKNEIREYIQEVIEEKRKTTKE